MLIKVILERICAKQAFSGQLKALTHCTSTEVFIP